MAAAAIARPWGDLTASLFSAEPDLTRCVQITSHRSSHGSLQPLSSTPNSSPGPRRKPAIFVCPRSSAAFRRRSVTAATAPVGLQRRCVSGGRRGTRPTAAGRPLSRSADSAAAARRRGPSTNGAGPGRGRGRSRSRSPASAVDTRPVTGHSCSWPPLSALRDRRSETDREPAQRLMAPEKCLQNSARSGLPEGDCSLGDVS